MVNIVETCMFLNVTFLSVILPLLYDLFRLDPLNNLSHADANQSYKVCQSFSQSVADIQ